MCSECWCLRCSERNKSQNTSLGEQHETLLSKEASKATCCKYSTRRQTFNIRQNNASSQHDTIYHNACNINTTQIKTNQSPEGFKSGEAGPNSLPSPSKYKRFRAAVQYTLSRSQKNYKNDGIKTSDKLGARLNYLAYRRAAYRLFNSDVKALSTSRRQIKSVCKSMAENYQRQVCSVSGQKRVSPRMGSKPASFIKQDSVHSTLSADRVVETRSSRYVGEKCNSGSVQSRSRSLFNFLPGSKERHGQNEACHQFERPQQVCPHSDIQNALSAIRAENDKRKQLVGIHRPAGRVLSCTDESERLQIPQVCISRPGIRVQGSTLRSFNRTESVYQNTSSGDRLPSSTRHSYLSIPRRLPVGGKESSGSKKCNRVHFEDITRFRIHDKLQKVTSFSDSEIDFSGYGNRHTEINGFSTQPESREISTVHPDLSPCREIQISSRISEIDRSDGFNTPNGAKSQTVHETLPDISKCILEQESPGFEPQNCDPPQISLFNQVVVQSSDIIVRSSVSTEETVNISDNRRIHDSLGCSLSENVSSRQMEPTPTDSPYKSTGIIGSVESFAGFSPLREEQCSSDSDGQYVSPTLHQQLGWHSVSSPLPDDLGHDAMVYDTQHRSPGISHSRERQCVGRQTVSPSSQSHRMVTERSHSNQTVSVMGGSKDRSFCNPSEHQDSRFLLSTASPTSMEYGCFESELEQPFRVCVPSISHTSQGFTEGTSGQSNSHPDCSELVQERMVPTSSRSCSGLSPEASPHSGSDFSGTGYSSTFEPSSPGFDGLEGERSQLLARGLSEETVQTCLTATSSNTRKTYSGGWRDFAKWCEQNDTDPHTATVHMILNYLQSLFDKGLSYNTVSTRACSIAAEHLHFKRKLRSPEALRNLPIVKTFFKGAMVKFPPVKDLVPSWDLPLVLDALSKHPFEPLEDISLRLLTIKTAFLVAMASAYRTCELKAFNRSPLLCTRSARGIVLRIDKTVRPKVVKSENFARSVEFVPLTSDEDPIQHLLAVCVCRALNRYIEVTQPILQDGCTQLFVTYQKGRAGKPAAKLTIAHWIKLCIQEAYHHQGLPLPSVQAHSTRKQSTSWADLKNISIQDICQQATWASANVFVKHYKLNIANSVSARHAQAVLSASH